MIQTFFSTTAEELMLRENLDRKAPVASQRNRKYDSRSKKVTKLI